VLEALDVIDGVSVSVGVSVMLGVAETELVPVRLDVCEADSVSLGDRELDAVCV